MSAALAAYAAYAVIDAARLGWLVPYAFAPVARVGLPLTAVLSLLTLAGRGGLAPGRVGWFGAALVPFQFLLAFGAFSPWVGLLVGVALFALDRPVLPTLGRRSRRLWLFVHVATSAGWLGLSLAMTVLAQQGAGASEPRRTLLYETMHLFDVTLVIPVVLASITTGLVLSLATPWGLFRHWWIVVKLALSLVILGVAAFWESFLVRGLAGQLDTAPSADAADQLLGCMLVFSAMVTLATFLSTHKPWGKTPFGSGAAPLSGA